MKRVYFFGTGYCSSHYADKAEAILESFGDHQIVGFLDNDRKKTGTTFSGKTVCHPDILRDESCDLVLIFLMNDDSYDAAFRQLAGLVSREKIRNYDYPLMKLLQKKYKDTEDAEIRETLDYISNHRMSIYNQFICGSHSYDEVKWDRRIDLPYIDFATAEGKAVPMYYPRNYRFAEKDGSLFVKDLMREQRDGSPHLYVRGGTS